MDMETLLQKAKIDAYIQVKSGNKKLTTKEVT
jgi:hypothetical protein